MVITNYTFDASAKTITFDDFAAISLARVQLITNVTDGIVIYQFNKASQGGTAATNVLTLDYNTTSMDDTDELMINYAEAPVLYDANGYPIYALGTELVGEDKVNNAIRIEPNYKSEIGISAASINNTIVVPSTDLSNYAWVSAAISNSGWTGTIIAQFSNNNSEWYSQQHFTGGNYQSTTTITAGGLYQWPRFARYFRLICNSTGTGTVTGDAYFWSTSLSYWANGISSFQSGNWSVRDGNTALSAVAAGLASNTVIKNSAGYLDKVLVTTAGTSPMYIYNNATTNSGVIVGIIPANAVAGEIVRIGGTCTLGITVDGDANNPAVTIWYN